MSCFESTLPVEVQRTLLIIDCALSSTPIVWGSLPYWRLFPKRTPTSLSTSELSSPLSQIYANLASNPLSSWLRPQSPCVCLAPQKRIIGAPPTKKNRDYENRSLKVYVDKYLVRVLIYVCQLDVTSQFTLLCLLLMLLPEQEWLHTKHPRNAQHHNHYNKPNVICQQNREPTQQYYAYDLLASE